MIIANEDMTAIRSTGVMHWFRAAYLASRDVQVEKGAKVSAKVKNEN